MNNKSCYICGYSKNHHNTAFDHPFDGRQETSHTNDYERGRAEALREVREKVEKLKYTDPSKSKYHADIDWTECEACVENHHHNKALEAVLSLLQDPPPYNTKDHDHCYTNQAGHDKHLKCCLCLTPPHKE